MATFEYIARDRTGGKVSGLMQADNQAGVIRALDEKQLFPIDVVEKAEQTAQTMGFGGGVSGRKLAMVYGQLSDLLRSGVPMMRSIETIIRTQRPGPLRNALQKVGEGVAAGEGIAEAMSAQPAVFNTLHVAMIRAGERGGFLEDVLANLSNFLEKQDQLKGKVQGALIYPLLLVTVGIGVVCFLLVYLVPRFQRFFGEMVLPLPSRVMFVASEMLVMYWPLLLLLIGGLAGMGVTYVKSERGRRQFADVVLLVPVVGRALSMVAISRFCRILGTLLNNGVPIIQSLLISRDAAGIPKLADAIDQAAENVRGGDPLHEPLRQSGLFPLEVLEMIAVAEESNQLEKTLLHIADTVERRTEQQVEMAVRLIEPVILVIIAAAIGFMALGLLLPIFNMASMIKA